jgi:hypothetical protein
MLSPISDPIISLALPVPAPIFGDIGFVIMVMVFLLIAIWFALEKMTRWTGFTKSNDKKENNDGGNPNRR